MVGKRWRPFPHSSGAPAGPKAAEVLPLLGRRLCRFWTTGAPVALERGTFAGLRPLGPPPHRTTGAPPLWGRGLRRFGTLRSHSALGRGPLAFWDYRGARRLGLGASAAFGIPGPFPLWGWGPPPRCGMGLRRCPTTGPSSALGRRPPPLSDHQAPAALGRGCSPLSDHLATRRFGGGGTRRFRITGACTALWRGAFGPPRPAALGWGPPPLSDHQDLCKANSEVAPPRPKDTKEGLIYKHIFYDWP